MNLREKLKRLDRQNNNRNNEQKEKNKTDTKLSDLISGKIINQKSKNGQYFHRKLRFKPDFKHGLYSLKDIKEFKQREIDKLMGQNNKNIIIDNTEMLFIDTETTGLMGGTGTVAFLIGIGYFNTDNFIVEQYFMRDFNEEEVMLSNLLDKLQKPALVSFNGKCFDIPLLKTRLILNRLPEFNYNLHLDLLHLARQIWSHLDSCSLNSLEEKILQVQRKEDVAGNEIPHIYFNYLNNRNPSYLPPIFKHNLLDIISLVTLMTHLLHVHNSTDRLQLSAKELFSYGKLLQKRKNLAPSIAVLEMARKKADTPSLKRKIDIKLSWQYKRAKKWSQATAVWKEMLSRQSGGLFPYKELAKYYEHQQKNYEKARKYSTQALLYLRKNRAIIKNCQEEKDSLEHRLQRLNRKIEK